MTKEHSSKDQQAVKYVTRGQAGGPGGSYSVSPSTHIRSVLNYVPVSGPGPGHRAVSKTKFLPTLRILPAGV